MKKALKKHAVPPGNVTTKSNVDTYKKEAINMGMTDRQDINAYANKKAGTAPALRRKKGGTAPKGKPMMKKTSKKK